MKILFIGSGNMAKAMAEGMKDSVQLFFYSPSGKSSQELASKFNGQKLKSFVEFSSMDIIFLAFKPQQWNDFKSDYKDYVDQDATYASVMAGISLDDLKTGLNTSNVLRFMPNTPIKIGRGAGLFLFDKDVTRKEEVKKLLSIVSYNIEVNNDDELNLLTTISGCGPAYVFEFIKYYSRSVQFKNLDSNEIVKLISKTFIGAAQLAFENNKSIDELIDQVTSKGGMTIEAIKVLRESDTSEIIDNSLASAYRRSKDLSS